MSGQPADTFISILQKPATTSNAMPQTAAATRGPLFPGSQFAATYWGVFSISYCDVNTRRDGSVEMPGYTPNPTVYDTTFYAIE